MKVSGRNRVIVEIPLVVIYKEHVSFFKVLKPAILVLLLTTVYLFIYIYFTKVNL